MFITADDEDRYERLVNLMEAVIESSASVLGYYSVAITLRVNI